MRAVSSAISMFLLVDGVSGQTGGRVDFERDVLPVLRQNCIGCHGPKQQNAGLRLDRRSSVIKGGIRRLVPGSSGTSMIYHRMIGNVYGTQMPPSGPLKPDQINVIKAWIDQGADWPDALANEADLPPLDKNAVALVDLLRQGDLAGFTKSISQDKKLLNARGPEESTPFMYAVLYSDVALLRQLLKLGADPNRANDGNATALMWAAGDLEKTRLLLEAGANPNVRSNEMRTPLMIQPAAMAISRPLNCSSITKQIPIQTPTPGVNRRRSLKRRRAETQRRWRSYSTTMRM